MERIVKYFKADYENDTAIEYVNTGLYSMLNCSFTSEDPDYGTDTIHYSVHNVQTMEQIAYSLLSDITEILNRRESKQTITERYRDYSNSTLIAIELALKEITKNYEPKKRFIKIKDAAKYIAKKMLSRECTNFSFCEADAYEEENCFNPEGYEGTGWYGIKRIPGFFDNTRDELIVACGYYGGGNCTFAYVWSEETDTSEPAEAIEKAICDATGKYNYDLIFVEEEE